MTDKLQQEIDEILKRADELTKKRSGWTRLRRRLGTPFQAAGRSLPRLRFPQTSISQLLFASIIVIIIGYVFFESAGLLGRILLIGGIGGFIAAFVISLFRTGQERYPEKRWRGQPIELQEPGVGHRFRNWWGRRRGRR